MKKAIIPILFFFLVLGIPTLCHASVNDSVGKPKYATLVVTIADGFFGSSVITLWDGQKKQEKSGALPRLTDLDKVAEFYGYVNSELGRLGELGYKVIAVNSSGQNDVNAIYTLVKE